MSVALPPPYACLLVVDAQRQFVNTHTAEVFPRIQKVLAAYQWVIASCLVQQGDGPIRRWKGWSAAADQDEGSALCIDLSVRPADRTLVVRKSGFGGFMPEAATWLAGKGVSEIHICGVDTDLCVLRSTFAVMEHGFRPVILSALCATTAGEPLQGHALLQLKRLVGKAQMM